MKPLSAYKKLMFEIASCSYVTQAKSCGDHACCVLVKSQTGSWQMPEPWAGHLDSAPLLFVGSNPAISEEEEYPEDSWPPEKIYNFFHDRFDPESTWVRHRRVLNKDGKRGKAVRFWRAVQERADEILGPLSVTANPGEHYALTEVVHCKSPKEKHGVYKAASICADSYFKRILGVSTANILIALGALARETIRRLYEIKTTETLTTISIGDRDVIVVFLPHPAAFGKREEKTLSYIVKSEGLNRLRAHLKAQRPKLSEA